MRWFGEPVSGQVGAKCSCHGLNDDWMYNLPFYVSNCSWKLRRDEDSSQLSLTALDGCHPGCVKSMISSRSSLWKGQRRRFIRLRCTECKWPPDSVLADEAANMAEFSKKRYDVGYGVPEHVDVWWILWISISWQSRETKFGKLYGLWMFMEDVAHF